MPLGDIYWVAAWVILALLPGRAAARPALAALRAGVLLRPARARSSRRRSAARPGCRILVARRARPGSAALVAAGRERARSRCAWWPIVSVSTFGMAAARAERDHQLDGRALVGDDRQRPSVLAHAPTSAWATCPTTGTSATTTAIAYRDVLREDPKARFLGPAYGADPARPLLQARRPAIRCSPSRTTARSSSCRCDPPRRRSLALALSARGCCSSTRAAGDGGATRFLVLAAA